MARPMVDRRICRDCKPHRLIEISYSCETKRSLVHCSYELRTNALCIVLSQYSEDTKLYLYLDVLGISLMNAHQHKSHIIDR